MFLTVANINVRNAGKLILMLLTLSNINAPRQGEGCIFYNLFSQTGNDQDCRSRGNTDTMWHQRCSTIGWQSLLGACQNSYTEINKTIILIDLMIDSQS